MGSKRVSERRDENDVHANRTDKRGKATVKERLPSNPQNGSFDALPFEPLWRPWFRRGQFSQNV
jgi:hypothetical protein